ncbi:hypothetical protein D3C87_1848100 [compost metagenome]
MLHFQGKSAVHGQQHHFKIQPEGTVVHIRAADGADFTVDQHHFLMQETRLVAEHPHAGTHRFEGIQAGGGVDDSVIRSRRQQNAHIHATQHRQTQCGEYRLVRDEIGTGDPDPFRRRMDSFDEE